MSFTLTHTADQAYRQALAKSEEQLNKNLQELDNLIVAAVEKGQFSIAYNKQLIYKTYQFDTLRLLTQMGYKVTEKTAEDDTVYWFISWDVTNND